MIFDSRLKPPRECVHCLYSERHPFGLQFDKSGLCSGCTTHKEKAALDWSERFHLLSKLVKKRKQRSKFYDCIVPVRGTPEYFYIMDVVKNRLGLNPLGVSYNSQFTSSVGIKNLARIKEVFDVDMLSYNSNPLIYRKLVRESLVRLGHIRWPYLAGETAFAVRVAVEKNIPLIVWPYHQPTEQVGMHSYLEEAEMSRRSWIEHDLMRTSPSDFSLRSETLITLSDIEDISYPENKLLARKGITGIYLANYMPWDTKTYSEEMIKSRGALSAANPRTFDTYDRIDDLTYMGVHDILKYANIGYSRVTDNLCREIRFGRIDRHSAKIIEGYYQTHYPADYLTPFITWLGITKEAFEWFLRFSNFGKKEVTGGILSIVENEFVRGFFSNHPPLTEDIKFTLYGKGLTLAENL